MLFPESTTYSAGDRQQQDALNSFYNDNVTLNQRYWREALIDSMFEAGDQSLWSGFFLQYPNMHKPMFNFNQLRRIKNLISGRQRQQRKSSIVIPSDNGADDQTADQLTKILLWNNRQENVLETISDAFDQALTTGMSLLHLWIDYRNDPISGDLRTDAVSYDSYVVDSFFRKPDFSDCRGIWRRTFVTPQECKLYMPKGADDLSGISTGRDGKFNYMAETLYASTSRNLLAYDEFYYRTTRSATVLVDPSSGAQTEWFGTKDDLRDYISYFPEIQVLHTEKPTVRLAVLVNGKVVFDDKSPVGSDNYPFVPVFGYFNPAITDYSWKIQGVIRALRDSAFLYNRINVILLDMLESKINSGWIYVDGKLVNPKDTYKTGQGQNIVLKPGAIIGQDISPIVAQEIPASYFQVLEGLANNPERISGVNEAMMGTDGGDKTMSGLLSMMRQNAGATALEVLFDGLDRSQRMYDKLRVEAIEANFTPGKIEKILGEKAAPHFYKESFGIYDVAITDGLNTTTQRQQNFSQLLELKGIGVNVPDRILIEAVTIQDKKKLIDAINQQEQAAAEMAQKQADVQMQELMARAELSKARATADTGLGLERLSRIEENKSLAEERRAAAVKDEEQALLNVVKALKEMDTMDLGHLQQAVNIMTMIKQQEMIGNEASINGQKTGLKSTASGQKSKMALKPHNSATKIKGKGGK